MKNIKTKGLSRKEWLKLRQQGIGGSDAGAVCGINPYRSAFDVYIDKVSEEVAEDEDSEAMRQGRDFEEYVAMRFTEATGLKTRRSNYIHISDEHPFMLADVDRIISGENAGLECKTASAFSADKWDSIDTIPESYIYQCQHYMAVMNWDYMYIACVILGKDFTFYKIDRDQELIDDIILTEKIFWEENVLKRSIPLPDASKAYDVCLNKYFTPETDTKIALTGFDEDIRRRSQLVKDIYELEKQKRGIEQSIKVFMGDNEVAENDSFKVTWKADSKGVRRFTIKEAA